MTTKKMTYKKTEVGKTSLDRLYGLKAQLENIIMVIEDENGI